MVANINRLVFLPHASTVSLLDKLFQYTRFLVEKHWASTSTVVLDAASYTPRSRTGPLYACLTSVNANSFLTDCFAPLTESHCVPRPQHTLTSMDLVSTKRLSRPINASPQLTAQDPQPAAQTPRIPYIDAATTFTDTLLCPRYAESDPSSAPPSPASVESFDVLDNVPWRRSYISLDCGERQVGLRRRSTTRRACRVAGLVLGVFVLNGCMVGGVGMVRYQMRGV